MLVSVSLRGPRAILGPSWAFLLASWSRLGAILGSFGAHLDLKARGRPDRAVPKTKPYETHRGPLEAYGGSAEPPVIMELAGHLP